MTSAETYRVRDIIAGMETDVASVQKWGLVLMIMADSVSQLEPEALHVVANALSACGKRIQADWTAVFDASR